jgi:hypothetical protein
LLRQLVTASDKATHDFLSWYLNSTFDLYEKAQHAANAGTEKLRSGFSEAKSAFTSPIEFMRSVLAGKPPAGPDSGEVETLRRRIEELEARLAETAKPPRRTSKRKGQA